MEKDEVILKSGFVNKKRKISVKKRFLILTNKPRLFYINTKDGKVMGEIEMKRNTKVFTITVKEFHVEIVSGRIYKLDDLEKNASSWADEIRKEIQKL